MKRLLIAGIAASLTLLAVACGGGGDGETADTPAPKATTAPATAAPKATAVATTGASQTTPAATKFTAAKTAITVDGSDADWASVQGATIPLKQIDVSKLDPAQVADLEIDIGKLSPTSATLKVAADEKNIYVLVEVEDGFDYNADPTKHNFSPSLGVMFRIDSAAPPTMGVKVEDRDRLGVVYIWHWSLTADPDRCPGWCLGGRR
jgi:hypothetical protein